LILGWIGTGLGLGLRACLPLALAGLLFSILSGASAAPCYVPWIFVAPPLVGGLVLMYVEAARRQPFSFGTLFAGFSEGRYWPSMGVFWMSALINSGASIPTIILLVIGFGAGAAAIAEWGAVGLLVLAILVPLAFAPAIYFQSRLVWAMPLVLDRRLPVMDAFATSWRLTGRLLKGFGMFVLLILLSLVGMVASAMVIGLCMAIFAGGVGVAAGGVAARQAELGQGVPEADSTQRPGESWDEYMARMDQESERMNREMERMMEAQAAAVVQAGSTVILAIVVAVVLWIVLSALLGPILAMPIFVGYRDMSPLASQRAP
jgi:hypothetical protein